MDRNYPKLSIEEFGEELLTSGDLDPVYIALYGMLSEGDIDREHLYRWLLAYILCYHCGAACWLSEKQGNEFFDWLMVAAVNATASPLGEGTRWPRSHERRHWRGQFAMEVVIRLVNAYPMAPEMFIEGLAKPAFSRGTLEVQRGEPRLPIPFSVLAGRVQEHHGFGDWAAFKLADLIDRLGLHPVDFSFNDVVIYKDPVLAAERLVRERQGVPEKAVIKQQSIKAVFDYLETHFAAHAAPPLYDRPVGLNEIETILCKWKSHGNGHYPLFNDLTEIHAGLSNWSSVSSTAAAFQSRMPKLPVTA